VRKDITINLLETIIMVEFGSKALILSRRVGSLYRREVKEGGRERMEEL